MLVLFFICALSVINMLYAAVPYLSWFGVFVKYESSDMVLMLHLVFTAPATLLLTFFSYFIARNKTYFSNLWKINLAGIFIPIMSFLVGGRSYPSVIIGLILIVILILLIILFFLKEVYPKYTANKPLKQDK